jgi:DNA-3-methyladenine glycosylase I
MNQPEDTMRNRCPWARGPQYEAYHDHEWGVPLHDEHRLFEFLVLEGAQAGLSWATILNKRTAFRQAFADFDPAKVAQFGDLDRARLLTDSGIVRNRLKIDSAIQNAKAFLRVQEEVGSFDEFLWQFVDGSPMQNAWKTMTDVPTQTPISDRLSKVLRKRGFCFVGSTICYALMQATGMVNDHLITCFRHREVASLDE